MRYMLEEQEMLKKTEENQYETSMSAYLRSIGKYRLLTTEEEKDLVNQAKAGDKEAATKLMEHNLRLVVYVAKFYRGTNIPIMDLVQEGNIGLMKAIDRFDPDMGVRFSTYAVYWIRQAISRSVQNDNNTIRIPIHILEEQKKVNKFQTDFSQQNNRAPSIEEIAENFDIPEDRAIMLLKLDDLNPVSIEAPLKDSKDETALGEILPDREAKSPEDVIEQKLISDTVQTVLSRLTKREREIIERRFGLNGHKASTLEEIGAEYGITRERVRQIEKKALEKMRHMRPIVHFND